ncbi:MAG: hypothetical protein ACRC18_07035 [Cetobacterium sp.]
MKNIIKGLLILIVIVGATKVITDVSSIQKGYTKENYNNYIEYKNSLIEEYGEEVYNLMNQEAGITTEQESFLHFMENGI